MHYCLQEGRRRGRQKRKLKKITLQQGQVVGFFQFAFSSFDGKDNGYLKYQ